MPLRRIPFLSGSRRLRSLDTVERPNELDDAGAQLGAHNALVVRVAVQLATGCTNIVALGVSNGDRIAASGRILPTD